MTYHRCLKWPVILFLMGSVGILCIWGQTVPILTLGDDPASLALFKKVGKKYEKFALVEVKGKISVDASGIVEGRDCFLRLQTQVKPDRWLKITKRELIKGRLVITTEDNQVFTVYDLSGNYMGRIQPGRFVGK